MDTSVGENAIYWNEITVTVFYLSNQLSRNNKLPGNTAEVLASHRQSLSLAHHKEQRMSLCPTMTSM